MKFKTVNLIQVSISEDVNHERTLVGDYCFYSIDDAVDFVVTFMHEFGVDESRWLEYVQVMKLTLNVKESDEH